jgi:hypothetical protein
MISRIVPLIAEVLCDVPTRRVGLITGPSSMNREEARLLPDKHTSELGPVDYGRIEVQPFAIERSGTKFALVPRAPEHEDDGWWVEPQPVNYVAFHEPWDSGNHRGWVSSLFRESGANSPSHDRVFTGLLPAGPRHEGVRIHRDAVVGLLISIRMDAISCWSKGAVSTPIYVHANHS